MQNGVIVVLYYYENLSNVNYNEIKDYNLFQEI